MTSAPCRSIVIRIRSSALSLVLAAGFLALTGGPLVAASLHDVCDAMHHGCAKIDALAGCCCGDASDTRPSRVPSARIDIAPAAHAAIATMALEMPVVTASFVHEGWLPLARHPDLRILFSDLRI
jgi:hypothetical protein